jgi:hypothetical protein
LVERLTIGLVGVTARQEEVVAAVTWCRAGALSWYSPQSSAYSASSRAARRSWAAAPSAPRGSVVVRGHSSLGVDVVVLRSPFSFPLLLFFLCFPSLCFSDLPAVQRGKTSRCGCGPEWRGCGLKAPRRGSTTPVCGGFPMARRKACTGAARRASGRGEGAGGERHWWRLGLEWSGDPP